MFCTFPTLLAFAVIVVFYGWNFSTHPFPPYIQFSDCTTVTPSILPFRGLGAVHRHPPANSVDLSVCVCVCVGGGVFKLHVGTKQESHAFWKHCAFFDLQLSDCSGPEIVVVIFQHVDECCVEFQDWRCWLFQYPNTEFAWYDHQEKNCPATILE